jgi:rRNA-processing protein FCF1
MSAESARAQEQEMTLAYKQKRQPKCVHCDSPLDEVRQLQDEEIVWSYDKNLKRYVKSEGGIAEKPYHPKCDSADWGYIDENLISF